MLSSLTQNICKSAISHGSSERIFKFKLKGKANKSIAEL